MKVVVLAGGLSTERDVSIISGTKVCEALQVPEDTRRFCWMFF